MESGPGERSPRGDPRGSVDKRASDQGCVAQASVLLPDELCPTRSWSEADIRIGCPRLLVTHRLGRWLTKQIGGNGHGVQEIADELSCDRPTVNDTFLRYGEALIDDDFTRFNFVEALGGVCADMAPDFEATLRLICENYVSFSQPWIFLKRNLSGKYRVTPMAGNVRRAR